MKLILDSMTKEELFNIIDDCQAELESRRKQERVKLIKDFENAFSALKDAHIEIRYSDYEQEAYRIIIDDIDSFEFG